MRDFSPAPMLSRNATFSSNARTARKSRSEAPGTFAAFHVMPPSRVRRKVPLLPLAQMVDWLTALTPRRDAEVPLDCGVHDCAAPNTAKKRQSRGRTVFPKVTGKARIAPYDL